MTREQRLELSLRRWAVSYRHGGFYCDECTGRWTRLANEKGRERHVSTCALYQSALHDEAPAPPEIPF